MSEPDPTTLVACCQPAPSEVRTPLPCTWPETDCYDNGPARAEACEGQCQCAENVGLMEPHCAVRCLLLETFPDSPAEASTPPDPGIHSCCGRVNDGPHGFWHCWTWSDRLFYGGCLALFVAVAGWTLVSLVMAS